MIEFLAGVFLGAALYAGVQAVRGAFPIGPSSIGALDYYTVPPQGGPYGGGIYEDDEPVAYVRAAYEAGEQGLTGEPYDAMRESLVATLQGRLDITPWSYEDNDE
jgi:hypothetical protein